MTFRDVILSIYNIFDDLDLSLFEAHIVEADSVLKTINVKLNLYLYTAEWLMFKIQQELKYLKYEFVVTKLTDNEFTITIQV